MSDILSPQSNCKVVGNSKDNQKEFAKCTVFYDLTIHTRGCMFGEIGSFQKHSKASAIKSNFKKFIETTSENNFSLGFVVAFLRFLLYRSGDDQEVLFDQILMGQMDFPSPYWDNVSDSAKVSFIVDDIFFYNIISSRRA